MDKPQIKSKRITAHSKVKTKKPARVGHFVLDRQFAEILIAKGVSATALATLMVLLAASDETNTISRAGIQAIRKCLGIGPVAARKALTELIEADAIRTIALDNQRDQTAPRFRIMQPTEQPIQIGEQDGAIRIAGADQFDRLFVSNALVRSEMGMNLLRTCIAEKDPKLLSLALLLHADPLGMGDRPLIIERHSATQGPVFGMYRIGYTAPFGVVPPVRLECKRHLPVSRHRLGVLADLGILEWRLFTVPTEARTIMRRQPIGTLRFGMICQDTPDWPIVALAQVLALNLGASSGASSNVIPFLCRVTDPATEIVAILSLRLLPDIQSVQDAQSTFESDCRLLAARLEDIVLTACPDMADRIALLARNPKNESI